MNVLIIDDEVRLTEALSQILEMHNYSVKGVCTSTEGLDEALSGRYDIILLDVMLPVMDGFEVLKRIREEGINTPVLMLTAKDSISDKVQGLDLGADDYLTKPFLTEELLARMRAVARRQQGVTVDKYMTFGDLELNISVLELICGEMSVKLSKKEFGIMEMLIRANGRLQNKEQIINKIWGYDSEAEYNNVEVYISFLRKKLEYIKSRTVIRTMRGVGYYLYTESL